MARRTAAPQAFSIGTASAARIEVGSGLQRSGARILTVTLLLFSVVLASPGCVERRMTIRTNVDQQGGALVIIDDVEVGMSPVSTSFTYYAPREIKLIKDGYEPLRVIQPVPPPWWDSPLLEFVTENLIPWTARDEREFYYELQPTRPVTSREVLERAETLRREARADVSSQVQ